MTTIATPSETVRAIAFEDLVENQDMDFRAVSR
jgi:hypothetical protein